MNSFVLITDDNYALAARTTCNSIIKSQSKSKPFEINILGMNLSEQNIELFEKLATKEVQLKILKADDAFKTLETTHPFVSKAALQKFLIPKYFENNDKILYLDCDILVLQDLNELFDLGLEEYYAAAVKDMNGIIAEKHNEKMNHKDYFNSGVMLLNLKKMRDDKISEKLIDAKEQKLFQHFMDQDEFNYVFDEKVYYLGLEFNFMAPNLNYDKLEIAQFYEITIDRFTQISKSPAIVHLTNYPKIWNDVGSPYFKQWIDEISPFDVYEFIIKQHNATSKEKEELRFEVSQSKVKAKQAEQNANEANVRAVQAEQNANKANVRAVQAEQNANEANERAFQAEQNANEANERAFHAEQNANEANVRAFQAEQNANEANVRAVQAEQNANEANERASQLMSQFNMIEGSNSWKITKPFRLVGKFVRWFIFGMYHWLTFSPTSRPRRVLKSKLINLKYYINERPKLKYRLMNILNNFPTLKSRLKKIGKIEISSPTEQKVEVQDVEYSHLSPQVKRIYNDLKYAIEQRKNEVQK